MQVKKMHSMLRYFHCPPEVTLKEMELRPPPEIIDSITKGNNVQRIPEGMKRVEVVEPPKILPPVSAEDVDVYVQPERRVLEVRKWRCTVCVSAGFDMYDYAVSALAMKCRQEFTRYRRIFLGKVELRGRIDRLLTWSLRSRLRYWWLRLRKRPIDFRTFPGRNRVVFTLLISAAVE